MEAEPLLLFSAQISLIVLTIHAILPVGTRVPFSTHRHRLATHEIQEHIGRDGLKMYRILHFACYTAVGYEEPHRDRQPSIRTPFRVISPPPNLPSSDSGCLEPALHYACMSHASHMSQHAQTTSLHKRTDTTGMGPEVHPLFTTTILSRLRLLPSPFTALTSRHPRSFAVCRIRASSSLQGCDGAGGGLGAKDPLFFHDLLLAYSRHIAYWRGEVWEGCDGPDGHNVGVVDEESLSTRYRIFCNCSSTLSRPESCFAVQGAREKLTRSPCRPSRGWTERALLSGTHPCGRRTLVWIWGGIHTTQTITDTGGWVSRPRGEIYVSTPSVAFGEELCATRPSSLVAWVGFLVFCLLLPLTPSKV
ncbi:hypothetical protein C8R44DRAFT_866507 [Mycena epipterygia]|nr:hypothetical protein C8R44DRAFT_866507 [Mycena epipterygia]